MTSPAMMTSPMTSPMTSSPRKAKAKGAPFVCGLCAKEFKNGYNLRRHQATHGTGGGATTPPKRPPAKAPPPTMLPLPELLPGEAAPEGGGAGAAGGGAGTGSGGGGGGASSRRPPRKSHACDTCGKAFRDVYHLKRHRLSHTDERPFQCPVCQQRFKRKDRMASHVRSHQGHVHKPYACGHCGKSFS
ncbi:myc-associated zinc finger protein-like, partial [Neopelma chrysocephalum]|uniref:myc-associated zinc finger protein-like n=1 Tax=Neopelma chrysocephalum TaxID=114329 RepID=UPI000FCD011F